jgi:beta/gamma crystallin
MNPALLRSALASAAFAFGAAQAAELTFYKQPNFTGERLTLREDRGDLGGGFNDQASSAIVRSGRWQVCTQPDFRGDCVVLERGEYASLEPRIFHRIESVRELAAYAQDERWNGRNAGRGSGAIQIFTDPGFHGHMTLVDRDRPALEDTDIYGASSLVVRDGTWELCTEPGFRGRCRTFEPGRYPNIGRLDNQVGSVRRVG